MCQPDDDMVMDLFHPFEDDTQHFQDDFRPSLDTYPFEDADMFYEYFQPLCSDFDNTRTWPPQRNQRFILPNKSIFILRLS
jgi:alpha-ketoglutarate-dependent taurine dioxygenase